MRKLRNVFLASSTLVAFVLPGGVTAQSIGLREGVRVRVNTPATRNATGVVQSLGADSLVIFTEPYGAPLRLSQAGITRLEVSQGRTAMEGAKKGALWGGIIGVISGAVILLSTKDGFVDSGYRENGYSTGELAAQNFIGSVGLGALIGALIKAERWNRVDLRARGY